VPDDCGKSVAAAFDAGDFSADGSLNEDENETFLLRHQREVCKLVGMIPDGELQKMELTYSAA
jgi:hypothetical protein